MKQTEGINSIVAYKRAKNILEQNQKNIVNKIFGTPDPVLFKNPCEENLLVKINEIKDYFSTPSRLRDSQKIIHMLSEIKSLTDIFFADVKVNEENEEVRNNRLELLLLMCKTFDNFTDFSKLEGA